MKSSRYQLVLIISMVFLLQFFLTRLVLLAISWKDAGPGINDLLEIFSAGLLFDSGFIAYAIIVPVLYLWLVPQKIWRTRWHGYWLNTIIFSVIYAACFIAVAELLFWDEFSVRFNFIAIDYLIYRREVTDNILQSYPVIPILIGLLFIALLFYLPIRPWIRQALNSDEHFPQRSLISLVLLVFPFIGFFTLNQPLRNISDNTYINELAGNGPYQFVAAFRNNELEYRQFYAQLPEVQADSLLRRELSTPEASFLSRRPFDIRRDIVHTGQEKDLNVILITVESLSSDFLAYFGNKKEITPNLDKLIGNSMFFENLYATGTRTTRGLEAITMSIPPTPGRSIVKRLGREKDQWSLGQVFNSKGYRSYFIYGGRSYFENMNSFFSGNGYRIVDQSNTPAEEMGFTNAWGMSDEDLYRQALKVANREHQQQHPFFLHLMTTSNHRPYSYPDGRIDIPSGSGRSGAVKYTDYAIGEFLRQAKESPWFADTVFVILADHQAGSAGKRELPLERYHIPLWIYSPAHIPPTIVKSLASQIDLAPTLLGLFNMSYRSCFFGKDILRTPPERALIANYQNLGLFDGTRMAILEPRKQISLQQGFDSDNVRSRQGMRQDPLVQRDISYYQGAAYVYRNRINAWSTRNAE